MSPQAEKQYYSVDTSEELGIVANASRHSTMTELDMELAYVDDTSSTSSSLSCPCISNACTTITDYLRSYRAAEMIFCLSFFLVTNTSSSWLDITPHERPIPVQYLQGSNEYVRNLTHDEPFDGETVPFRVLILLSGVFPLVIQVLLSLTRRSSSLTSPIHEVHQTLCVYFVAWSLNMIAVEFVKNYVGYLRPLFFQYCQPNDDYSACTTDGDSLRKSFPSGHSATSFCGMTLLSLYIHQRFGVYSKRRFRQVVIVPPGGVTGKTLQPAPEPTLQLVYPQDGSLPLARLLSIVALVPLFIALWIAASRVRDNKHFPADVLAGALIGATLARYSHSLWFV